VSSCCGSRTTPGSEPRLMLDGLVWKLRTPTRPATVASIKIGARLITSSGLEPHDISSRVKMRKLLGGCAHVDAELRRIREDHLVNPPGPQMYTSRPSMSGTSLRNASRRIGSCVAIRRPRGIAVPLANELLELVTSTMSSGFERARRPSRRPRRAGPRGAHAMAYPTPARSAPPSPSCVHVA